MGSSGSKNASDISSNVDNRVVSVPHQHSCEHVNELVKGLNVLRENLDFCDVIISAQESVSGSPIEYHAHKCVLAASSGYFREKLGVSGKGFTSTLSLEPINSSENGEKLKKTESAMSTNSASKRMNILVDFYIEQTAMEAVLRYIYSAVLDAKPGQIPSLLEAAVRLKIKSLKRRCLAEIQIGYSLENFQTLFELSNSLDIPELRDFVLLKTIASFDIFVDTLCYLQLSEANVQEIVNHRNGVVSGKCVITELQMFNAILQWLKYSKKDREESAIRLLKCLHYNKIPQSTLNGYVLTHDIICGSKDLIAIIEPIVGSDKRRILERLKSKTTNKTNSTKSGGGDNVVAVPRHDSLVVTGGRLFDQFTNQVLKLNEKEWSWREMSRMPIPLAHHCVAVASNLLFVAGGEGEASSVAKGLSNVWSYDPARNCWETLPDMQQGRSYFYMGTTDTHLFVIGGKGGHVIRNSVERYCFTNKKWEFASCLKLPRYGHAGCNHKSHIYISGGVAKKKSTCDLLRYDPHGNHWTALSSMRSHRSRHTMSSVRDRIYVLGGELESLGVIQQPSIALECYTPQCDQWHTMAPKINFQGETESCCVELSGLIFVIGGSRTSVVDHRYDVMSYDPDNDLWKGQPKLPRRLRGAAAAMLKLP